jgi:release factor glutamine methyltransferase
VAAVDLGTGSGAIAIALAVAAAQRGRALRTIAVDASEAALAVARRNAARHGVALDARRGDWWQPLAGERVGLAIANPPYIAAGDPHLAALRHEPEAALVAGSDGLLDLAAIVDGAPRHLLPGAWLLLEHGRDQGRDVRSLLAAAGFAGIATRRDLAGNERATGGRRP